ncbi:MAG: T9SS type A sorting domain-containing protein [Bacteroidia bacterium]
MKKTLYLSFLLLSLNSLLFGQITVTITNPGGCNATLTANATGGTPPYTYTWYYGSITQVTLSNTFAGYNGGFLYLRVRGTTPQDTGYVDINLPQPFQLNTSSTPPTCPATNGTATVTPVGGTAPFTYLWSNGATTATISGLGAGSYNATVTDATGCSWATQWSNQTINLGTNSPMTATTSSVPSWCHNGEATVSVAGGTSPYNYYWNTSPVQTTQTATGLNPGTYSVTVTDANGCTKNTNVSVANSAGPFNITMTSTPEYCYQSNGTATCTATGGTPPYTYLWSTGATTSSIAGLSYGTYHMTLTDAAGCEQPRTVSVARTNPVNATASAVAPTCGNLNGSIALSIAGGNPPYTYSWGNGATTSSITGLGFGNYGWSVADINGCTDYGYNTFQIPGTCLNTVSGKVYDDDNLNCILDFNETRHRYGMIAVGSSWAVSDQSGNYSKGLYQTGSFSVSQPTPLANHTVTCPTGPYTATFAGYGGSITGYDFGSVISTLVEDFEVQIFHGPARPGFNHWVKVVVSNRGSTSNTINLTLGHDPAFTFLSANPTASNYIIGTSTVSWNSISVNHGSSKEYLLNFYVPITVPIHSIFSHAAFTSPIGADVNPLDNQASVSGQVTGSFDPNEKVVYQPTNLTPADSILSYTVHFQNTGNDTAFTIEVLDTLDQDLNIGTLQMVEASVIPNSYNWGIEGSNILRVTFPNIKLPDSTINEPLSHGHFSYRIKLLPNLPLPIHIDNRASIYFDYNLPILTNTTHNQLEAPNAVTDDMSSFLQLYPNPSSGMVTLKWEGSAETELELRVVNLSGQIVHKAHLPVQHGASTSEMDLRSLPGGVYIVEVSDGLRVHHKRLVLQR